MTIPDKSQIPPAPPIVAPFSSILLTHISTCIKSIMSIDTGTLRSNVDTSTTLMKLRLSLLSNRNRSELLHAMILVADNIVEMYNNRGNIDVIGTEWIQLREKFMGMLDN